MLRTTLTLIVTTLVLFGILYPLSIWAIGQLLPHQANGKPLYINGELRGFENIAQAFTSAPYFWSRPSDVDYNGADTGGSNFGPSNQAFHEQVKGRIAFLLEQHPEKKASDIPVDLVTSSGSGLDPHISLQAAIFQLERVAKARGISENTLMEMLERHTQGALLGLFGPKETIHVLKLNIELDQKYPLTNP
ncbi:potassium-transporting ATPase subunit C [Nitritalea halalkaliphila LW7]|uniref:Potassium-transporting ATPase KdpC subunit n=1 Tax=Nitritalea halalkaliphila LW7 TaxID=1189621 RepID=I5C076_9BACT|nr:potassium-transporting ATPase subunit KdpC [Nitritalea halalkaliphila]EIM75228.1 potassium-transporting ATPase subunit C [Nitritalea halalkaliphila LW7]